MGHDDLVLTHHDLMYFVRGLEDSELILRNYHNDHAANRVQDLRKRLVRLIEDGEYGSARLIMEEESDVGRD